MTAARGRGRPTVFGPADRVAYLDLLRHGARLGEAAEQLGVSRAAPARYARTDPEFAAAVEEAREVGAKVRREGIPHGEYRYNVLGCRCPACGLAARAGRTTRRTNTAAETDDAPPASTAGDVHPIRQGRTEVGGSSTSFLLARAS